MSREGHEPHTRRGLVIRLPGRAGASADGKPVGDADQDAVELDESAPDVLDLRAQERDAAALARDQAANEREARLNLTDVEQVEVDRLHAARDRAAAALDREEAALDRHRAAQYLQRTYRDELTGALQREAGRDRLIQEVDRAQRARTSLVVAFLDVIHLKKVNDERGHDAGDALLHAAGAALREGLRSYDIVVRYGGDEFVCALPNSSIATARPRFAEVARLLDVASPGAALSLGLAELRDDEKLDSVVRRADRDLYTSRRAMSATAGKKSAPSEPHDG